MLVYVILVVTIHRKHVVVFMNAMWVCLSTFGHVVVIPIPILGVTIAESTPENLKWFIKENEGVCYGEFRAC